jgi:hypothetical protein
MPRHAQNLLIALSLLAGVTAFAQATPLPWGQQSDMQAWETLAQIVAPAGNPQNTNVEFETWASDQDIYTASPQWPAVGAPKRLQVSALGFARHGTLPQVIAPSDCKKDYDHEVAKAAGFPADGCIGEEVRRNWASFQYIVTNHLYTKTGFAEAYQKGLKVNLPADAIEFKGDWVPVTDVMKWLNLTEQQVDDLYYVNTATAGSVTTKFALVSFHFSSKQVADWIWADFEHEKNPGRCDDIGCHDDYGAVLPDVSAKSVLWQQYGDCQKTPAALAIFNAAGISKVWQHYCLKGSQTTFTTASGEAILLGNTVIEAINASVPILKSSCMTCHAYASFDKTGAPNIPALKGSYVGNVDPAKLQGYASNDFIWGIVFAPQ